MRGSIAGNASVIPIHVKIFNCFGSFLLLGEKDLDKRILQMRDNNFIEKF